MALSHVPPINPHSCKTFISVLHLDPDLINSSEGMQPAWPVSVVVSGGQERTEAKEESLS